MKLFINLIFAAVTCVAMQSTTVAQEASAEKQCCSKEAGTDMSGDVKLAMAKLPKMGYMVAGESACCLGSAEAMAKSKSAPVEYVVGDDKFETKQAAYTSLVEQTEAMVEAFVTPCKCEVSGVTSIAGTKCNCPVKAGETTELVKKAISGIQMAYAVGDETCHCPTKAKEMAEAAGVEKSYVVNGEKTSCELTARLNLARSKYRAAVTAMVAQNQQAEQTETTGT